MFVWSDSKLIISQLVQLISACKRIDVSVFAPKVDCIQEAPREETPPPAPPLAKFQSIGVQVEDGWQ